MKIVFFVLNSLCLILLSSLNILPQADSSYIEIEEFIEDYLQEPDESLDNSDLFEIVERLILNPININSADILELQQIPGIDAKSISSIIEHRNKHGNYFSIDELYSVDGLSTETLSKIKPFVTVKERVLESPPTEDDKDFFGSLVTNSIIFLRSRYSTDLQTRKGFTDNKYLGSKLKSYNRLLFRYNDNLQAGLLIEKDPGEIDLDEFSSYHVALGNIGFLNQLIFGDYLFEFGQGLAMWGPYGFSKGGDAIYPVKKKRSRLKPYTSTTENNYFKGIAGTLNFDNFYVSAFYSRNQFDANIDSVTGDILSRPIDGFHRTTSEISRKQSATETSIGSSISFQYENEFKLGLLYYRSELSNDLLPSSVFDLRGNTFNFTSFYYDLLYENMNIFGEFAFNGTSIASINSLSFYIGRNLSFITSIRSYPRNYISLHGFAFGERSGAATNEFGFYTGITWQTLIGTLNFYYDQFIFPFATFLNPRPGNGDEFFVELISNPYKQFITKIRYKYESKDISKSISDQRVLIKRLKQLIRFEIIYHPIKSLRLRGRFDYNTYKVAEDGEYEEGYSIFQDVRFSPGQDFSFYFRTIFFKTHSFNSAIYEYENDLTGVLPNYALFGEGIRWYLLTRYRLFNLITLSLKYTETYKPDEKSISSGLSEIIGNIDNRFSFQLDIRF